MKHRTGLRNRFREGNILSPYCRHKKKTKADHYGTFTNGYMNRPDVIAGHVINEQLGSFRVQEQTH